MKDKILLYSQLDPDEQAEIEAYVAQHPDSYPLLLEARALGEVLREAQRLHADLPDDEVLAYYLATRQLNQHPAPPSLEAVCSRIEARLQTDEALRARYDQLARRMAALDAGSNTLSHFEQVTGHHLSVEVQSQPSSEPEHPYRVRSDRGPLRRQSGRVFRRIGTAVGGVLAAYLVLFAVSTATTSPLDDAAAFTEEELIGTGATRGLPSTPSSGLTHEERYEQALGLLRNVRTSTLGLFPHYDASRLTTAGSLLEEVATQGPESMLQLEAAYLLAKVRLAQHNVPAAREVLAQVIHSDTDWRKADAQALLEEIPD